MSRGTEVNERVQLLRRLFKRFRRLPEALLKAPEKPRSGHSNGASGIWDVKAVSLGLMGVLEGSLRGREGIWWVRTLGGETNRWYGPRSGVEDVEGGMQFGGGIGWADASRHMTSKKITSVRTVASPRLDSTRGCGVDEACQASGAPK